MKIKVIAIGVVCLLFLLPIYSKEKDSYGGIGNLDKDTLEYKLAVINAGGYVPKNHHTVARFRSLLRQLSDTYVENRQQIADMSVKAQQILKDEGIKESLLNIMEGLNQLFPRKVENQTYAEYSAAYLTLRSKGQSHRDAIEGLKALIQAIIKS